MMKKIYLMPEMQAWQVAAGQVIAASLTGSVIDTDYTGDAGVKPLGLSDILEELVPSDVKF